MQPIMSVSKTYYSWVVCPAYFLYIPCDKNSYFPVKPEVYLWMRCYCGCGWWIVALLSKIESFKLCPLNYPLLLHVDKEAAERLSKTVDEACLLLAEYNGRLAAELEDRRQLARMLIEYTQNQKDVLTEKEKKLEVSTDYTGAGKPIVSPNAAAWLLIYVFLSREMILGVISTFGAKQG